MADILIKNIESLKKDKPVKALVVHANGDVEEAPYCPKLIQIPKIKLDAQAVTLPEHGHLTEKSAVWDMLHEICVKCNDSGDINRYPNRCVWCKIKEAYDNVYGLPTVLEASKGTVGTDELYEQQSAMRDYCMMYEPSYNPEDGSM